MDLKDLLAASGLPGLYRMIANRNNGLVLQHIGTGKTKFAPMRKHNFTPLETISIYTEEDTVALSEVFGKIKEIDDAGDLHGQENFSDDEIQETFEDAVPNYDKSRVYLKDMKKVFAWYHILKTHDMLVSAPDAEEE